MDTPRGGLHRVCMRALLLFTLLLVAALGVLVLRPFDRPVRPERAPIAAEGEAPDETRDPLRPPTPQRGERFVHALLEPPAERYGPRARAGDERAIARVVAEAGADYDSALGQAARELAAFYAREGALMPTAGLAFLLDAGGASAWGVRQAVVVTHQEGDAAIHDAIVGHIEDRTVDWQIGVGEAERRGQRVIAVLIAPRTHALAPVARRWSSGDTVQVGGRLLKGARDPHWVVMRPDLEVVELPVDAAAGRFDVAFEVTQGTWIAELVATGTHGPTPLTQLTFHVDEPLPTQLEAIWPPDEDDVADAEAAADRAAALLAEDRARFGLAPLTRDPALDAVARAHCDDMRDHDFVGHVSPRTGGPGDRIRSAGWKAAMSGENVALNRSLWDAEAGLLRSLGHRRNILSRQYTHVGFGAARRGPNWYVTQLFALPPPVISDIDATRQILLRELAAARRAARAPALEARRALERVAQREAKRRDPTPRHALDQAGKARITGKVSAWVGKMSTLEQFEPKAGLLAREFRRVGVGVHQTADAEIRVVILLAE